MRLTKTKARWAILIAVFALIVAACSSGGGDEEDLQGQTLEVMASWGGDEQAGFEEVISAFEADTGVDVTYVSEREVPTVLPTRVAGGNPPDIAFVPRPGIVQSFVDDGAAISFADLGVDMDTINDSYAQGVLDLGTFNDQLYGLLTASNSKSTFWYKPASFDDAGYSIPTDWTELIDIINGYVAAGKTPLAIGGADGWTLTDWFENIYVRVAGPDMYNDLFVTHDVAWTDPTVVEAMNEWSQAVLPADEKLAGGASGTNSTGFTDAWDLVLGGDAEMYYEGGFMGSFAAQNFPDLVAGEDYTFFNFPEIDAEFGTPVVGGGDLAVAFTNTAASRAFIDYMASQEANEIWAQAAKGPRITPNQKVSADTFTNPLTAIEAELIKDADIFVFDGSDLAPGAVGGDAMFTAFQNFINGDDIDSVLQFIENAAQGAY
jgi:alpha-glucoside transport system substrate-binding protein